MLSIYFTKSYHFNKFFYPDKGFANIGSSENIKYPKITDALKIKAGWIVKNPVKWGDFGKVSREEIEANYLLIEPSSIFVNTTYPEQTSKISKILANPLAYHSKAKNFMSLVLDGKILSDKSEKYRYCFCADILCWHELAKYPEKAATLLFDLEQDKMMQLIKTIQQRYQGKIEEFISSIKLLQEKP